MKRFCIIVLAVVAAASCYDDKSNYDYREINEIIVEAPNYSFTTPREGQSYTMDIVPVVTQTLTKGTDNLAYEWKRQSGVTWEVVCDKPVYTIELTSENTASIELRLGVTDTDLGITTYKVIMLKPVFKFEQCWFVLHQATDGHAVLGSVDGEYGERAVTYDILAQETGGMLTGAPRSMGVQLYMVTSPYAVRPVEYEIMLGVFTDTEERMLNGSTLDPARYTYDQLLYGKNVAGYQFYGTANNPQLMRGGENGTVIVDGGTMWFAQPDQMALMFAVPLDSHLGGGFGYEITQCCNEYSHYPLCVVYDRKGNRFLLYSNQNAYGMGLNDRNYIRNGGGTEDNLYLTDRQNNAGSLISIGSNALPNAFDPDRLASGLTMDYMGMARDEFSAGSNTDCTVMAVGHIGTTLHIYEISMMALDNRTKESAYCNGYWSVAAEGLGSLSGDKIQVATSRAYGRTFFYATDTKVYRVNLYSSGHEITEVYEVPAGDKIRQMKFKNDYVDIFYGAYSEESGRSQKGILRDLTLVVEQSDGTSRLTELRLTTAGEIEIDKATGERVIYEFDGGFRNVTDIIFSYQRNL